MIPLVTYYTTCCNRTSSLFSTLQHNLKVSRNLPVEFVLIDYGSSEDVSTFLSKLLYSIPRGPSKQLRAYRTEATFFRFAHAKNVAARQAHAPVICNLDADDFLVPGMFEFMLTTLGNEKCFIAPPDSRFFGRIAFRFSDFESMGGYDERFDGYGYEDTDLVRRAELRGSARVSWPFTRFEIMQEGEHGKFTEQPASVTLERQRILSEENAFAGIRTANIGQSWGQASLVEL